MSNNQAVLTSPPATNAPTNSGSTHENPIWNIAKLVMAFLVVGIHTSARTGNVDIDFFLEEWLGRFAVPLFFCIAGYFLFTKISSDNRTLNKADSKRVLTYAGRILKLYVIWTVIYLLPQGYEWFMKGVTLHELLIYVEYAVIRGDSYVHLWYLSALCMAVFLVWLLNRKFPLHIVFIVAIALYAFGLIWLPHHYLVQDFVDSHTLTATVKTMLNRYLGWPRNGLFFGFVYVTLGAMLSRKRTFRSKSFYVAFFLLFFLLSFGEVAWIYHMNNRHHVYGALQLFLLPATYFLFCALHTATPVQAKKVNFRLLRYTSTFIYCIHPMIQFVLEHLRFVPVRKLIQVPFAEWILVYVLAFAVSYLLVYIEKEKHITFPKYLR